MRTGILGIDIGGTRTKYGLIDSKGNLRFSGSIPTRGYSSLERYLEVLFSEVRKKIIPTRLELIGVGIGAPKGNQRTGCIEEAYNLMTWGDNLPVAAFASDLFGVPAFLLNDGDAAAKGEKYFGAAQGCDDFLVITLGTGVGSGIYANGRLVTGSNGAAGEIGHIIIDREGRLCNCGRHGCLETYASAPGIVRTMRDILVWKRGNIENPQAYERCDYIAQAAAEGDELALKTFEYTGRKLGLGLADMAAIFDPEAIILSGGVANAGDLLLNPVKRNFEEAVMDAYKGRIDLRISSSDSRNMAVLGAAGHAREHLEERDSIPIAKGA